MPGRVPTVPSGDLASTAPPSSSTRREPSGVDRLLLFALLVVTLAAYADAARSSWGAPGWVVGRFGIAQWHRVGPGGALVMLVASVGLVANAHRVGMALRAVGAWVLAAPWRGPLVGLLAGCVAWSLPTLFRAGDGYQILKVWPDYRVGACVGVSHDELLEMLIHQWVWCQGREAFGWSIEDSFRLSDAIAAVLAVSVLVQLVRRLAPRSPMLALGVALAGGWTQIYFGNVEVYTLTSVPILVYLLTASRYLSGEGSVYAPTVALTVGMLFHLQCGFLLPSLVALWGLEAFVRRRAPSALAAAVILVVTLAATEWVVRRYSLAVDTLYGSHAFGSGEPFVNSLAPWTSAYLSELGQLLLLLLPGAPLLLLLAVRGWVRLDRDGWLLVGATACELVLFTGWRATFGPAFDWDLFANTAIPPALLLARSVVAFEGDAVSRRLIAALLLVYATHSAAWIVSNAWIPPIPGAP